MAIKAAETQILIPKSEFQFVSPGSTIGSVYDTIQKYGGIISGESYNEIGELEATVMCETSVCDDMKLALKDGTRGEIKIIDNSDQS